MCNFFLYEQHVTKVANLMFMYHYIRPHYPSWLVDRCIYQHSIFHNLKQHNLEPLLSCLCSKLYCFLFSQFIAININKYMYLRVNKGMHLSYNVQYANRLECSLIRPKTVKLFPIHKIKLSSAMTSEITPLAFLKCFLLGHYIVLQNHVPHSMQYYKSTCTYQDSLLK